MNQITILDLEVIDKKLRKIGIKKGSFLGNGDFGITYKFGNKVLKITQDLFEAKASSKLIGKKLKNVVNIYRVFRFASLHNFYFIIEEPLKEAKEDLIFFKTHVWRNDADSKNIDKLIKMGSSFCRYFTDKFVRFINKFPQDKEVLDYYKNNLDDLKYVIAWYIYDFDYTNILAGKIEQFKDYVPQLIDFWKNRSRIKELKELTNGLSELKKNGIYVYDAHEANIMKKGNGELAWTDLSGYGGKKIKAFK